MPTTPNLALPYPDLDDAPDVPFCMQQLAEAVDSNLGARPRCKIVQGADQNIPSGGSTTVVDFAGGTVAYDTAGMADIANDRIVIPEAGFYLFSASVRWFNSTGGYRGALITRGTTDFVADLYLPALPTSQGQPITVTSEPILCAEGDAFQLRVNQTSGGTISLQSVNSRRTHLAAWWLGSQ